MKLNREATLWFVVGANILFMFVIGILNKKSGESMTSVIAGMNHIVSNYQLIARRENGFMDTLKVRVELISEHHQRKTQERSRS